MTRFSQTIYSLILTFCFFWLGFYKIIKKYDKILNESKLEEWLPMIDKQQFVRSGPQALSDVLDQVTSFASRDKLIEWEVFAKVFTTIKFVFCNLTSFSCVWNGQDMHKRLQENRVFPLVRFHGLVISLVIFFVSLGTQTPSFWIVDPVTGKGKL